MNTNLRPGLKLKSRILSLEEANHMLPLLRGIVRDVMGTWSAIIQKRTELEIIEKTHRHTRETGVEERIQELKAELNQLIDRINGYIREVEELGCFVEEFKRGVINFPSLYLGRKIFLCWTPDDSELRFWHELDESYNERSTIRDQRDFLVNQADTPTAQEEK